MGPYLEVPLQGGSRPALWALFSFCPLSSEDVQMILVASQGGEKMKSHTGVSEEGHLQGDPCSMLTVELGPCASSPLPPITGANPPPPGEDVQTAAITA